ncbi:baculoviral IAP repeat-containing protein 7 [Biomphalaria pfeifferi]|uniref:Baculoviral IAP repeat-containing protein 7 n=1 Tax=Biomphalaria pfeifferi TaxID=112525 RepID=A0AAD8C2B9_BIOPF|nr:baculoviral IAP repeat-containing protein 7 [Biomphalaria pfeifferi]
MTYEFNSSYFFRLASFKPLSFNEITISCLSLARHGYYYTGHDLEIECQACGTKVDICEDNSNFQDELKHNRGCHFNKADWWTEEELTDLRAQAVAASNTSKVIKFDGESNKPAYSQSYIKGTFSSDDDTESSNKPVCVTTDSHDKIKETIFPSDEASEAYTYNNTSSASFSLSETYTGSEAQRKRMSSTSSSSSSRSSGYHSDTSNESETSPSECTTFINASLADYYDFPDLFSPEFLWFNSSKKVNVLDLNRQDCDKNPGHFSYFPWISLKLEQIPSAFRVLEMFDLLKLMGELTVKITVSTTSKLRPSEGLTRINGCKARIGTGFAIEHACHVKKSHGSEQSKYKHFKKWFKLGRKKDIGYVYIQTSRHLVFNDEEAQNAVVEFFYDTADANDVITLEGTFLLTSSTAGDNQCLLVCECSDLRFIHKINQLHREFVGIAHRLPLKAKKRMSKKMFMIHHPHGCPKVLSYGDYVRLKYRFNIKGKCRATLTKLTANEQVPEELSTYRKALFYATDTCPGSSGAPILTFFSRPPDVNNIINYKLDLWTHTGVETTHKLGVSVLKVCTLDDIYQLRPEGAQGGRLSITEEDSEDEDSLGKQKVNSTVYKVLNAPCHPEYSLFHIRLDSYGEWTYMPSPNSLASNGFFYTGETDCVRCFQCGLGLRSWKQGDDVLTQHEKFRPTCPFLMSLAKRRLNASTEAIAIADSETNPGYSYYLLHLISNVKHRHPYSEAGR